MNGVKGWSRLTIIAILCAALGGVAAVLWFRNEPKAEALSVPRAAYLERVDGEVGLDRSLGAEEDETRWALATPNTPLTAGDRVYAGEESSAGVAFTGRNYARLEPDTALDVLSLTDRRTQVALRDGSALFDIGALEDGELYEVATPYGAVELREPGLYQVGMNDDGSAFVSVLSGLAQVVGLAGSGEIGKGEVLTLLGQTAAEVVLSRLDPEAAGGLLGDYYGYRYGDAYDGRYDDYDAYLSDPYYYDPARRYVSYQHVPAVVPGAWALDSYGDWQEVGGYGYAWRPRVEQGWAPYQQGHWAVDDPHGLTWVSSEPWGYAPYHYGRWANVNGQWYWVPDAADTRPAYAPALVAFLPLPQSNQIGWVPLAPGEQYVTPYYDAEWQPHYYGGTQVVPERIANFGVPGAVAVVHTDYLDRDITPAVLVRAQPTMPDQTRPVLDPLSHAMLRQATLERAVSRRGFTLPPGLAKRLDETPVYASAEPPARPFRNGRARRVEAVSDKQKGQKLRVRDERREDVARRPEERRGPAAERGRTPVDVPAAEAARGREASGRDDKEARREARRDERDAASRGKDAGERRGDGGARAADEKSVRKSARQAQGERVTLRRGSAKHDARPQPQAAPSRQRGGGQPNARASRGGGRPQAAQKQQAQPKAARKSGPPSRGGAKQSNRAQGQPGKGKGKGRS